MMEDPFVILGIDENATDKKVESAFRRLALKCHPDRHPNDPLAKARFLRLSRAKEALLDPAKRRAALCHHRSRGRNHQKQTPSSTANTPAASQRPTANEKQRRQAAEKRRAAAELLRKRERDAAAKRRQEEAEAKRRCEQLAAAKEAEARERAAERERHKADLFDAFLRKKQEKTAHPNPEVVGSVYAGLVERFAATSEHTLKVPGPLSSSDSAVLRKAAENHGLTLTEDMGSFRIHRRTENSEDDSPWEPPEGTRADMKAKRLRKQTSRTFGRVKGEAAERHRKAVERLHARRLNGEGLPQTPQGSWWVHDAEAERWSKYVEHSGF